MEKKKFLVNGAIWIAVVTAIIIAIIGLCFGKVIEENLFAEVTKWIVVTVFIVIGVFEGLWFSSVGLLIWHWKEKKQTSLGLQMNSLEDSCASETCAYRGQGVCTFKKGEYCPMYTPKTESK